jgi:hypothetical protein
VENLKSTAQLYAEEEMGADGSLERTRYVEVIQYGIAVDLVPLLSWLRPTADELLGG